MGSLNHTLGRFGFRTSGGRGRDANPPSNGGNGDGYRPGSYEPAGYYERLRRYRLAVAVFLASVIMIFVALSSAYIVRQGLGEWDAKTNTYRGDWRPLKMPDVLLLINTCVLIASSLTLEAARRNLNNRAVTADLSGVPGVAVEPERSMPWLGITLVLGTAFLAGQYMAWRELLRAGVFISTNPSSSFFYVLTGAHAVHLSGGLLALIYAALATALGRPLMTRRIVVDATAWYWHFMALLWIYIFALLHFAR